MQSLLKTFCRLFKLFGFHLCFTQQHEHWRHWFRSCSCLKSINSLAMNRYTCQIMIFTQQYKQWCVWLRSPGCLRSNDSLAKNMGITVLKIVIWGWKSSVLWSETTACRHKMQFQIIQLKFTLPNDNIQYDYPHSTSPFHFFSFK